MVVTWNKSALINSYPESGNSLRDWITIAARHGIDYNTLLYRVNQLGWDLERAATQSVHEVQKL